MSSDRTEIFRSAYEEYTSTHSRLHETQRHLNNKAVEITKINLLVGGIAASVITIRPENIALPYFISGTVTLLTSIWFSAVVYSQTKTYDIGIGESAFEDMASAESLEKHFEDLSKAYRGMVGDFNDPYQEEAHDFENALWAAIGTIFLFIAGAGSTVILIAFETRYPMSIDIPVILGIGILLMYGKHRDEHLDRQN